MVAQNIDGKAGASKGGKLFRGLRSCILQRVPSKPKWIELCKANGDQIVRQESYADIVVADNTRTDCPPGSISWKYIDESVEKGVLQNKDDYRAGPHRDITRVVDYRMPHRLGRIPFTAEDDKELRSWVTQTERAGHSTRGNRVYKELRKKNDRHTWGSWRARWMKKLINQPGPLREFDNKTGNG